MIDPGEDPKIEYDRSNLRDFFRDRYQIADTFNKEEFLGKYRQYRQDVKNIEKSNCPIFPDGKKVAEREQRRIKSVAWNVARDAGCLTSRDVKDLVRGPANKACYQMAFRKLYNVYLISQGNVDVTVGQIFGPGKINWPGEKDLILHVENGTSLDVEIDRVDLQDEAGGSRQIIAVTKLELGDNGVSLLDSKSNRLGTIQYGFKKYLIKFRRGDGELLEPKSKPPPSLADGDHIERDNAFGQTSVVGIQLTPQKLTKNVRKVWSVHSIGDAFEVATCVTKTDTNLDVSVKAPMEALQCDVEFGDGEKELSGFKRSEKRREKDFDTLARENLAAHLVQSLVQTSEDEMGNTIYLGEAILLTKSIEMKSAFGTEEPEDA